MIILELEEEYSFLLTVVTLNIYHDSPVELNQKDERLSYPWSKTEKPIEQMWPRRTAEVRGVIKEVISYGGAWEVEHSHQIARGWRERQ